MRRTPPPRTRLTQMQEQEKRAHIQKCSHGSGRCSQTPLRTSRLMSNQDNRLSSQAIWYTGNPARTQATPRAHTHKTHTHTREKTQPVGLSLSLVNKPPPFSLSLFSRTPCPSNELRLASSAEGIHRHSPAPGTRWTNVVSIKQRNTRCARPHSGPARRGG